MSNIDDLMAQIPIEQVATRLGVSEDEARNAVRTALPTLVGGMAANADDPAGAASLDRALGDHDDDLLQGGVDLGQVDTADGEKIVRNVFGSNEDAVVNQLGGIGGLDAGMIAKLLPMLAPLVMSFLAKLRGGASEGGDGGGGGGLGDLLGGVLGGGGDGGGGLGGLFPGGGGDGGGGGGLGDLLGGLLGGGKR